MTNTPDTKYHKVGCAYKTAWENYYKGVVEIYIQDGYSQFVEEEWRYD